MTMFRTSSYEGAPDANITAASQEATTVFLGTGSTSAKYATGAKRGTSCGRFTGQANIITTQTFPASTLYWRGYYRMVTAPNANRMLVEWQTAAGGSLSSMGIDTTYRIRLRDSGGVTRGTSVSILSLNTWYGLLYTFDSVSGTHSVRIYEPNGDFLEEVIGAGTAGSVGKNREGILQGDTGWYADFDDTAIADTVLELTRDQIDPEEQGPTDPYRTTEYSGTVGGDLQLEEGNGYYSAFDGIGKYKSGGFNGGVCAEYTGQYALRTQRISPFGFIVYWQGWMRPVGIPDTNRVILEMQTTAAASQAAVGIDTAGKWRLRKTSGITVAVSNRKITPGQWYGGVWVVNRTTGVQEFRIYSYFGSLLEVLTGECGTATTNIHLEGCTQGRPTWSIDFDKTVLHRLPQTLTSPLTEVPSNLRFRDGKATGAPQMTPYYWNGTALAELSTVESL